MINAGENFKAQGFYSSIRLKRQQIRERKGLYYDKNKNDFKKSFRFSRNVLNVRRYRRAGGNFNGYYNG